MTSLTLYHRTTREAANIILTDGFRDATGTYMTFHEFSGVWLSNMPLDANEGAKGDVLLQVRLPLPESAIAQYEWIEEFKPYREWLVPAAVINPIMTVGEVQDDD